MMERVKSMYRVWSYIRHSKKCKIHQKKSRHEKGGSAGFLQAAEILANVRRSNPRINNVQKVQFVIQSAWFGY